jgi:hypothetical protein
MSQLYLTVLFIITGGIGAIVGDRLMRGRYRQYFCLGSLLMTGALLFGLLAICCNWPDSCLVLTIVIVFFGLILTIGNDVCDQLTGKMPKAGDWWLLDEDNDIVSNSIGLVAILVIAGLVVVHGVLHSNHDLLKAVSGFRSDFRNIYFGDGRPAEASSIQADASVNTKPIIASAKKSTKLTAAQTKSKTTSKQIHNTKVNAKHNHPVHVVRVADSV